MDELLVRIAKSEGVLIAIAIDAAIRVAILKWTEEDTREFGTKARDILKALVA